MILSIFTVTPDDDIICNANDVWQRVVDLVGLPLKCISCDSHTKGHLQIAKSSKWSVEGHQVGAFLI